MEIHIDINKSQEVDYNPKPKRKRVMQEDYDYSDDILEREENGDMRVEIEPFIQNFFVYAGELKEDPKRVTRKYNACKKQKQPSEKDEEPSKSNKYTLRDEYLIKNEMIVRNNSELDESMILEYFLNSLITDHIEDARIVLNKVNIKDSRILDKYYLSEEYEILKAAEECEEINLKLLAKEGFTDVFLEQIMRFCDVFLKILHLNIYIEGSKWMSENKIRNKLKKRVNDILNDESLKFWPLKLHYYKKKIFYKINAHYLNSTLTKSAVFDE